MTSARRVASRQVVNFLNSRTRRLSNQPGFKLDALLKLADTKSPYDRKYTLLHYVVEHCDKAKPGSIEAASRSVACCSDASSYPFDMVDTDFKKLQKSLTEVEKASSKAPTGNPADAWGNKMTACIETWHKSVDQLKVAFEKLQEGMEQICLLWCVEKKPAEAEHCFENLGKLMKLLTSDLEQLRKEKEKMEADSTKQGKRSGRKNKRRGNEDRRKNNQTSAGAS